MLLLSVSALTHGYEGRTLFDGLAFGISDRDRVAVVGPNGSGKSTLLRLIAGAETPLSGAVVARSGLRIGYVAQSAAAASGTTASDWVFGQLAQANGSGVDSSNDSYRLETTKFLTQMGVEGLLDRQVDELSGGERRRMSLAAGLGAQPDLLILDEPTNHLDIWTIDWLERYLRDFSGAVVFVSHDRWFMDRTATAMLEIADERGFWHDGSYADVVEARASRSVAAERADRRHRNALRKELAWLRRGPKARSSKPRFRLEQAQALREQVLDVDEPPLRLGTGRTRLGNDVIELQDATVSFGDRQIISPTNWGVGPGDRIGIIGPSGSGKSTLLGLLAGELQPSGGRRKVGKTVQIGMFHQVASTPASLSLTVSDYITSTADSIPLEDGRVVTASDLLERFGFSGSMKHAAVKNLSGGERRRVELCKVLMDAPNVLILDEPTNDLDIETLQAVEDFLDGFKGSLLVASHDRLLLDRLTDVRIAVAPDGAITQVPYEWDEYSRLAKSWRNGPTPAAKSAGSKPARQATKLTYADSQKLKAAERSMDRLQRQRDELTTKLEGEQSSERLTEIGEQLRQIVRDLDAAENTWLELSERAEQYALQRKG